MARKKQKPDAPAAIEKFDGRNVIGTTIAITNAGDGLSKAMETEPQIFHHQETVYVVIECEVAKVSHVLADPGDEQNRDLRRLHVLRAGTATIVDAEQVIEVIAAQAEKNKLAEDAKKGIQRIPGTDGSELPDDGL